MNFCLSRIIIGISAAVYYNVAADSGIPLRELLNTGKEFVVFDDAGTAQRHLFKRAAADECNIYDDPENFKRKRCDTMR